MKSKQSFTYKRSFFSKNCRPFLPLLFLFLAMFSCSGGGIGGTGFTDTGSTTSGSGDSRITCVGPITALGGIFLNGIEFETTGAAVAIDGVNSDARDLQVGMVVKVEGTVNADGRTGKASVIVYDPNVEGPITSIDLGKSTLTVTGQTVLVDGQTIIAGLTGNTLGLTDLAANDIVEISGLADADGNIKATRITRKTTGGQSEVSGRVSSLTDAAFKINALDVNYSNAIFSKFGSAGIQPGDFVEVKGTISSPTTLLADTIEKKNPDFKAGNIEIEAFIDSLFYSDQAISGFAIITPFGLQGVELTASTQFSGGQLDSIKAGARVEVEGTIQNNIIKAKNLVFF